MAKPKYYVVWKGRRTGIFTTWEECDAQVNGYPGARYQGFATYAEAEAALAHGPPDSSPAAEPHAAREKPSLSESYRAESPRPKRGPITPSVSVDAACSGNPGPLQYRAVRTESGKPLFEKGPFDNGTNNIGEFLAIVDALRLLAREGSAIPIYSDSLTARAWVRQKKARTALAPDRRNARLFKRIAEAEKWLSAHSYPNPILEWNTAEWGENPADYGRK